MHRVALLIGGNQGDRRQLINQATELIRQRIGSVVAFSKVHETEPWGDFEGNDTRAFLNRALLVETELSAEETLHAALEIENALGRKRHPSAKKYQSRPMDIDIIFYDNEVIDTPDLVVPHPRMHLRRFVLEPLAEIMPDYVHPLLEASVVEIAKTCQ